MEARESRATRHNVRFEVVLASWLVWAQHIDLSVLSTAHHTLADSGYALPDAPDNIVSDRPISFHDCARTTLWSWSIPSTDFPEIVNQSGCEEGNFALYKLSHSIYAIPREIVA
jgi:hypothetical protein